MGKDGLLKHLHMAFCLGKDGKEVREREMPTICVQRSAAKHRSLFTSVLEKTHNASKLVMLAHSSHIQPQFLGSSSTSYVLIPSFMLLSALSVHETA